MSDVDLRIILNELQRARMRRDEGDDALHVLDELLGRTYAPAVRLRAAPPRTVPPNQPRELRNERDWPDRNST